MKNLSFSLLFVLCSLYIFAQAEYSQTIRGTVTDQISGSHLVGATIVLIGSEPIRGAVTDFDGNFRIENVPIGRQGIQVSFIGYKPTTINNIIVSTGKEIVLQIKLEEQVIVTEEIIIKAYSRKDRPINDLATISARSFTIEETERFAGSLGDPSRMAANYAGVSSAGDSRNDIIIRGNSPVGLLWRLDGINIPNPNHFGALGTTGGPVSMLNNNLLSNSDFFTGAFPAEYGNALSGAFDLRMRNGNNEKYEFVGQAGFNGFELGAEGPFSKNHKASYLINYRYSVLDVVNKLGLSIGTSAVPQYQDLSFKIDVPGTKAGRFSLFGIAGISYIELIASEIEDDQESYNTIEGTDTYNGSNMGVVGLSHLFYFDNNSRIKSSLAISGYQVKTKIDTLIENSCAKQLYYRENNKEIKYSLSTQYSKKINTRNNFSIGIIADNYSVNYLDSVRSENVYKIVTNTSKNNLLLFQGYAQWQHLLNEDVTLYSGLHLQSFPETESFAAEPRLSLKWQAAEKHSFSTGYGLHSQTQPFFVYYIESYKSENDYFLTNTKLDFTKSHHFVFSYDFILNTNFRIKAEAYYQHIYNIPVEKTPSAFSMANYGAGFHSPRIDSLENKGTAKNYGMELTIEKFFSNNYYFLLTTSIFDSKYKGSNGVEHNTAFNGNYVINFLGGYEFNFKNNTVALNGRIVNAGGKRTTPIDIEKSVIENEPCYFEDQAYEKQLDNYFRFDFRISFRTNSKKITQEWALDIQNLTDHKNIFTYDFNVKKSRIETAYQSGFFPMMLYRINF